MDIVTALGNEDINNKLRKIKPMEIIGKDIQYQEAVIEVLEHHNNVELLILSSILPGELKIEEFINIIKYKIPKIEIIIILEKENEKLEEYLISKGINNIYYNNKITFDEIIKKINEINNQYLINNKINNLEKIIIKKNKINILEKIKKILKKLIKKIKKNKIIKNNKKIITIIGAKKIGKTIFSLILSLNIKSQKILIIDVDSEENNMKVMIGKKIKNDITHWKNNIDILSIKQSNKNNEIENFNKLFEKYYSNYEHIIIDLGKVDNRGAILKKSSQILLLVEPNLLGLKETREILEEVVIKQKNQKDNIKIIYNKADITSICKSILEKIFSDFKSIGYIDYNKKYNLFINTNGKILDDKTNRQYLNIINRIGIWILKVEFLEFKIKVKRYIIFNRNNKNNKKIIKK